MTLFTVQWYLMIIFAISSIFLPFASFKVLKHFYLSIKTLQPILKFKTYNVAINLRHVSVVIC